MSPCSKSRAFPTICTFLAGFFMPSIGTKVFGGHPKRRGLSAAQALAPFLFHTPTFGPLVANIFYVQNPAPFPVLRRPILIIRIHGFRLVPYCSLLALFALRYSVILSFPWKKFQISENLNLCCGSLSWTFQFHSAQLFPS